MKFLITLLLLAAVAATVSAQSAPKAAPKVSAQAPAKPAVGAFWHRPDGSVCQFQKVCMGRSCAMKWVVVKAAPPKAAAPKVAMPAPKVEAKAVAKPAGGMAMVRVGATMPHMHALRGFVVNVADHAKAALLRAAHAVRHPLGGRRCGG